MEIKFQSFLITVSDIARSRDFCENLLSQKVLLDHGRAVDYEGGLSLMDANYAFTLIHSRERTSNDNLGSINSEIYFDTPDLEGVFDKIKNAGVGFVHPVVEQPWGQRVFRFLDPDGYTIEIGEPMEAVIVRLLKEGKSCEEVAERTSTPIETVKRLKYSL